MKEHVAKPICMRYVQIRILTEWEMEGMRQLIEEYAKGYEALARAIDGVTEELLHFKPTADKWSIKEIVIHIGDSEMAAVQRMKKVIAEDNPLLMYMDQDLWVARLDYQALNHEDYVMLFKLMRASMTPILQALKPEDWDRTGVHNVAGKQTLREIVRMYTDHIYAHVAQIERNKQAFANRA